MAPTPPPGPGEARWKKVTSTEGGWETKGGVQTRRKSLNPGKVTWVLVPNSYVPKGDEVVVQGKAYNGKPAVSNTGGGKGNVGGLIRVTRPTGPEGPTREVAPTSGNDPRAPRTYQTKQVAPTNQNDPRIARNGVPTKARQVAPTSQNDSRIPASQRNGGRNTTLPQGAGNMPGLEPRLEQQRDHQYGGAGTGSTGLPAEVQAALDALAKDTGLEYDYQPGTAPTVNLPDFPTAPSFDFKRNDFTDEANAAMARAYGPRYAAIDAAKQSVVDQQARSDEIIKGIYTQLYSDLNAGAGATKEQYDTAATAASTAGTDTAAAIRANAKGANADLIAELTKSGSSPEEIAALVGTTQTDTNAATAGALTAGQQNQQYLTAQGTSANDLAGTMAAAAQNQGAVSREQVAADAAQAVQGYSNQAIDLAGQQSTQALGYGQDLSQQDMDLQKMKYGVLSDQYQGQVGQYNAGASAAFSQAGLEMQQRGMNQDSMQFMVQQKEADAESRRQAAAAVYKSYMDGQISAAELMMQQQKITADDEAAKRKDAQDMYKWGQEFGLKVDQSALGTANDTRGLDLREREIYDQEHGVGAYADATGTGASATPGLKYGDQAPLTQVIQAIAAIVPGNTPEEKAVQAQQYYQFVATAGDNDGSLLAQGQQQFITTMKDRAVGTGLNPDIIGQAASKYWEEMQGLPSASGE